MPLHLLMLEDSENDAAQILYELRNEGLELTEQRVENENDFRRKLREFVPDLILSDYSLPHYDGMSALAVAREICPTTPFIFVSGVMHAETVVEALHRGATDYVVKQRLGHLGPVVRRALREAELILGRNLADQQLRLKSAALHAAANGIVVTDRTGIIEWINPAFTALTGYSAAEAIGKTPGQLAKSGRHDAAFYRTMWETILAGQTWRGEVINRHKDGRFYTEELSINSLRNEGGEITNFIGISQDVTQSRQAGETLRETQANLARAESFSNIMVVHLALDGRWLKVPPLLCQLLGFTEAELLAGRIQDRMHPEDSEADWQQCQRLLQSDLKSFSSDKRFRNKAGQSLWFETNVTLVVDSQGAPERFLVYLRDITENRRSEEQIRAQAALLDLVQDAIVVRDLTGRILYWNKGAEKLYGWTSAEILGQDAVMLYQDSATAWTCLEQTLKTGEWSSELEKVNKAERTLIVQSRWTLLRDASGLPQSILIADTDITEKKQVEAQFLRSQRLESVGRLASGIAHDLNNILAPILIAAPMLRAKAKSDETRHVLDTIESCAVRGASIVKQVLAFGRGIEGQRAPLQLRHLLKEMAQIIRETFPKSITLRTLSPHDLWSVTGDATQLHQVLMNLCVNARDAMPAGGVLILAAGNVQLDETFTAKVERLQPGPHLFLTVTDTGTGISPENLDRIFEPFFTTKPIDLGTGLGLSTVFGIVKSHGGIVLVASTVGKGTQFTIYLPATDSTAFQSSASEPRELPKGNGELILVVDDEEGIRDVTAEALQISGYRTLAAQDGAEAMVLYASHRNDIQVVVTDLMMPVMDGIIMIRAMRQISPELKIIVTSGLGSHPLSAEAATLEVDAFLLKPYTMDSLLNSLWDILHPQGA